MVTLIAVGILVIYFLSTRSTLILSHRQKQLDGIQFSPLLFYDRLALALQARNVAELRITRVVRREGSIFTPKRECLRVAFKSTIYDVCAAPIGTGSYVSWWEIEERSIFQEILRKSPTMEMIMDSKSEYQRDSEMWFVNLLHIAIDEAIADTSTPHGMRGNYLN